MFTHTHKHTHIRLFRHFDTATTTKTKIYSDAPSKSPPSSTSPFAGKLNSFVSSSPASHDATNAARLSSVKSSSSDASLFFRPCLIHHERGVKQNATVVGAASSRQGQREDQTAEPEGNTGMTHMRQGPVSGNRHRTTHPLATWVKMYKLLFRTKLNT